MSTRRQKSFDRVDDDYDYSDDFVSEDESEQERRAPSKKPMKSPRGLKYNKKSPLRKKGQHAITTSQSDYITQRMLSAGRIKMNELRNLVEESNMKIKDLQAENKILKKMQYRQEKALKHYQDKEGNLPQLLSKHANEVRALKEQLRVAKEKYEKTERYLRDAEDDLDRAQNKLKKYKQLVEEKNLMERDDLNRKLSRTEIDLEEKETRIKDLERHIEHLTKNHRHELGIEMASHRETKKQLEDYKEENAQLKNKIKEKEKELEIKNIYSNRIMRPPHKLPSSYSGTPLDTPPPAHGALQNRAPSLNDLSSREKAKLYERKRREEGKIHREVSEAWQQQQQQQQQYEQHHQLQQQQQQQQRRQKSEKQTSPNKTVETDFFSKRMDVLDNERNMNGMGDRELDIKFEKKKENEEKTNRFWREPRDDEDDDELKQQREKIKRESEELQKRQMEIEERQRKEFEEKLKQEREGKIRDRELVEKFEREQQEKKEREKKEREQREKIEKEERASKEREEKEKREREEKRIEEALRREQEERMKNDAAYQEERRKKDLLLARMKAIDEGRSSTTSSEKISPTPSRKQYHHTQPIKNLHDGKPAYDDLGLFDKSKKRSPDEFENDGYQPSFSSPSRKSANSKKEDLMKNLFGDVPRSKSTTKQNDVSDLFLIDSANTKTSKKKDAFPWDKADQAEPNLKHFESTRRENSSTMIFSGGAAFLEDDKSDVENQKLLPRRPRVPVSTIQSKPSVTAVDSIEDEIEEVII